MNDRRNFLGKLTGVAALMGLSRLSSKAATPDGSRESAPLSGQTAALSDPDEWFTTNVKGKHKLVVDGTKSEGFHTFASPRVFLISNTQTGSTEKDCSVVVVLRADAYIYALNDSIWAKYKFGEKEKIEDPRTNSNTTRNPYLDTKPEDYTSPLNGNSMSIGIKELQANGVLFCVCDIALLGHATNMAKKAKLDPATVRQEWIDGLIPGVQRMPSGIFAVSRAQEHGCAYVMG